MTGRRREELKSSAKSFEDNWLTAHPKTGLANYPFVVIQDDAEYRELSRDIQDQIQLDLMPMLFNFPLGLETDLKIFANFNYQVAGEGCGPMDGCYMKAALALIKKGAGSLFPAMVQYEAIRARHEFNTGISAPELHEIIRRSRP